MDRIKLFFKQLLCFHYCTYVDDGEDVISTCQNCGMIKILDRSE